MIKNKILVIHFITSLRRGGRERQLATIYKFSDKEKETIKIITFYYIPNSYLHEYNMEEDVIFIKQKSFIKRLAELRNILLNEKPDIIWTWGGLEATYAFILSFSNKFVHINGSIRNGIVRFNKTQIERLLILHLSKNIVANSKAGLKANRIKRGNILYNGIDGKFFSDNRKENLIFQFSEENKSFSIDCPIIISLANFEPYKDYFTIFKALEIIRSKKIQFKYLIIGEGPDRIKVEKDILKNNLGEFVILLGHRQDVTELLSLSDLFIHSSRGEGCSNAILEAMAAGLPVIASNTGGTSEIVNNSVGRLFEFQNEVQLADRIEELILDKNLREQLGNQAKIKARNEFSIERMMSNYYSIIEEALL